MFYLLRISWSDSRVLLSAIKHSIQKYLIILKVLCVEPWYENNRISTMRSLTIVQGSIHVKHQRRRGSQESVWNSFSSINSSVITGAWCECYRYESMWTFPALTLLLMLGVDTAQRSIMYISGICCHSIYILIPPMQSVSLNISFTQNLHGNTDFCAEYLPTSVPAKLQHKCLASELSLNWIQIGRNIHLC